MTAAVVDAWEAHDPTLCDQHGREACEDQACLPVKPPFERTSSAPLTPPAAADEDPRTEAGAAQRFARQHGGDVRFDYRRNRWLMWDGQRWIPDSNGRITRLAIEFARRWQRDALQVGDLKLKQELVNFACRLERRDALNNVLALVKALKPVAETGDQWDADPYALCTPTGVVDLRNGTLRAGRREDRITMQTSTPFDPAAECPRFYVFLAEVFDGDDALVSFVHRAVGYSLTGDTTEQCLFLLYGRGANGKGTFVNTLKRALGDYSWNMPFATIEMHDRSSIPNDLAALANRRFVTASETNDGTRLNEARVKALTGCDPMTARFLHSEFFTFEPVAKFWLSVNHKPVVRDDSFGFWRRLRLIPFTRTFAVNSNLGDALAAEAEGILAWAVRGALAWQREGLDPPPAVMDATAEYERESDPLALFLEHACELEPTSEVGASELFHHYSKWADNHGLNAKERLSATKFGSKLSERFTRKQTRDGRAYVGIARRPL